MRWGLTPHSSLLTFRTHFIVLGATTFGGGGTTGPSVSSDFGGGPLGLGLGIVRLQLFLKWKVAYQEVVICHYKFSLRPDQSGERTWRGWDILYPFSTSPHTFYYIVIFAKSPRYIIYKGIYKGILSKYSKKQKHERLESKQRKQTLETQWETMLEERMSLHTSFRAVIEGVKWSS